MNIPKYSLPEGQGTRGYAVLIANETFNGVSPKRGGAAEDLKYMKTIARALGLDQLNSGMDMNLDKDKMLKVICDAAEKTGTTCDMFLFMISTHGDEQKNPRKSGQIDHALMSIDGEVLFVSDVVEKFNDKNCQHLAGKPKLFFFQACRVINHFLYMEQHSEMKMEHVDGQLKISNDKGVIQWTSRGHDSQSFSAPVSSIIMVQSSKTRKGPSDQEFVISFQDGSEKCFIAETDSAVNYWVVGLTQLILPANKFQKTSGQFIKFSRGQETKGILRIQKQVISWNTTNYEEGIVELQAVRAGKSQFTEGAENFADDRCFSVLSKYCWHHFVAGDGVSCDNVRMWIKEITYMIHYNKIGVDEGIAVQVADTDGVTVVPGVTDADDMDVTESDASGGPDSRIRQRDIIENPELPPIPKREEPVPQLAVNVFPRKTLPFHPHALAPVYKCYNDMLIMTSSPSGMLAWRTAAGKKAGSWMIRFIKEAIEKSEENEIYLTKVLTKVAYAMANEETKSPNNNPARHGMKSVCVVDHQLLKALVFSKCA